MAETTAVEIRPTPWVTEVTRDAVRHFAWGIGDNNPLWLDPEYAAQTRWCGIIAPPCFAYAADDTMIAPGLDDHRRVYASVEWVWRDAFRLGQCITATARLLNSEQARGPRGEPGLRQTGRVDFGDGEDTTIAHSETRCLRLPADSVRHAPIEEPHYSAGALEDIERTILAERCRGSEVRYFEDTQIGDTFGPLLKGPLSIMDGVAWTAATQGVTGTGEPNGRASGQQMVAWASHLLTHWFGDDGFLHRLRVDLHADAALGDTTTWHGEVTDRRVAHGIPCVEVAVRATNQRTEVTASGTALVLLASTVHGPVRLPVVLP